MPTYRIIPATLSHAEPFVEHLHRHFAESGVAGDPIFHPLLEFGDRDFQDDLSKTVARWKLDPGESGWEKAWLVVDERRRVYGHADLRGANLAASRHRCTLGMGLEREVRGQGFGAGLMRELIDWCRSEESIEWIDLYVFEHNQRARRLYESFGFELIGQTRDLFRVRGESITDLHMVLNVGVAAGGG